MRRDSIYDDQALELSIGQLLRVGVTLSALMVLAGGVLYLVQVQGAKPDYATFRGMTAPLGQTVSAAFRDARAGRGSGIIQVGLLLLIATPVARVVLAAVGFLRERDWKYSAISAVVLVILVYSLLFGK